MKKIAVFVLALSILGCERKKLDFDQVDDLRFKPRVEVPLVNAHLDLQDLAEKDTSLVENPDGSLSIVFQDDSLYQVQAIDFVSIPEQNPVDFSLSTAVNPIDYRVDLGTVQGVELYNVTFHNGQLLVRLNSIGYSEDAQLEVEIANATDGDGTPLKFNMTLPAGDTSVQKQLDLRGTVFDLTNSTPGEFNYIAMRVEILNASDFAATDDFTIEFDFRELMLRNATGFFGERTIAIPAGNFEFDITGIEELTNGFMLTDPRIALIATSTVGLGLELETDFKAVDSENNIVKLDARPAVLKKANAVNDPAVSRIEYNKQNSNIVNFLASVPNRILYSGEARVNPNGRTTNFIDRQSELNVGVDIEIPLEVSIENMKLEEEVEFALLAENKEEITELELIFRSYNGFPLSANLQVEILDSLDNSALDTLSIELLQSAITDDNGRASNVQFNEDRITVSQQTLENLKRSNRLRLIVTLNSDPSSDFVKFYTDYALDIRIAAIAQLNLQL